MLSGTGIALPLGALRPYVTFILLECTADEPRAEIGRLRGRIETFVNSGGRAERAIIATTKTDSEAPGNAPAGADPPETEADAIIFVERSGPSWARDSDLTDTNHGLAVWLSQERFVAIHADGFLADALQRWLDREPRPMFRRIHPSILEGEVFRGEVKNLWLRGVHPRRRTMADTKYLSGPGLQDALNPLTDSSFALGAGRAELALDSEQPDDRSPVGCSPMKSTVWVKQSADFHEFLSLARSILRLVADAVARGPTTSPLPWLATRLSDLSGIERAYALVASPADDVVGGTGASSGARAAASVLDDAELHVRPLGPATPDFLVDVGLHGRVGGTLRCSVSIRDAKVHLAFGFEGEPPDITIVRPVLDALEYTELLTVYYESGHALTSDAVWSSSLAESRFPAWEWMEFDGFNITREKPGSGQPDDVHSLTGSPGETSLFTWVVRALDSGYLTCDDGPGEVADFVHLANDETLSLIHVKAASSDRSGRGIAVQRFEVVVGQAVKNIAYLDPDKLIEALNRPRIAQPACWLDGARVPGRSEMLEFLGARSAHAPKRIIVVQPHVTMRAHEAAWMSSAMPVRLLDTLLNAARGSITGVGAEFHVWGARD
ncbi:hypothetical protein Q6348_07625 [Isoptericola sp. b441]|uniref:Uncharacterized protein n=1 Tax=Actinotalea lenta TaxID=3064654 RepID=A0ABT9DCP8_9CELL|nr:hypothetical protein [Isoptericola sp. b441]MDO8107066.1 hypothetical protein [Isoptericola sp. b441]